jgi:hypothetical protein
MNRTQPNDCLVRNGPRKPQAPVLDVKIRQEEIDNAIPRNSGHCMIAESIKRDVPWAARVAVDLQTIRLTSRERGLRFTYLTPRIAQLTLVHWDQGIKPEPFKIRLTRGHVAAMSISRAKPAKLAKPGKPTAQRLPGLRGGRISERVRAALKKPEIRMANSSGSQPLRVGGPPPPSLHVRGARRAFGLRAMEK